MATKLRTNIYSDQDRQDVGEMRRRVLQQGPPLATTPYGDRDAGDDSAFVSVVSSTRDDDNWRWTYTLRKVRKTATGFDGWEDIAGAIDLTGYNTVEKDNGASGTVSGITLTTDIIGLYPIADGTVTRAWRREIPGEQVTVEWHFTLPNAPIVDCGAGDSSSGGA